MFPGFPVSSGYGLPVPYTTSVAQLAQGAQIQVVGTPTGNRFEVNLRNHQNDVVLHFNPRFDDNAIIFNTSQHGTWGQEERQSQRFQRGVRFILSITVTHSGFSVSIDNSHVCEFRQRVPLYAAQILEVKGDIQLESAQVYPGGMGGSMNFPGMNASFTPVGFGGNVGGFNMGFGQPPAPSVYPMGGGIIGGGGIGGGVGVPSIQSCRIHTGSRIFVRGYIQPGANRFELNLLQGYNDSDDIAFHFNPRFNERKIVKNYRRNGQWGQEENQPFPAYMPLVPGQQVDLQIACLPDRYTVLMNNHPIADYAHKITPGSVMAVQYKGDITITGVGQL